VFFLQRPVVFVWTDAGHQGFVDDADAHVAADHESDAAERAS
jgi:hypothetical protein